MIKDDKISITYHDGYNFITFYLSDVNWKDHRSTLHAEKLEEFIQHLTRIQEKCLPK